MCKIALNIFRLPFIFKYLLLQSKVHINRSDADLGLLSRHIGILTLLLIPGYLSAQPGKPAHLKLTVYSAPLHAADSSQDDLYCLHFKTTINNKPFELLQLSGLADTYPVKAEDELPAAKTAGLTENSAGVVLYNGKPCKLKLDKTYCLNTIPTDVYWVQQHGYLYVMVSAYFMSFINMSGNYYIGLKYKGNRLAGWVELPVKNVVRFSECIRKLDARTKKH